MRGSSRGSASARKRAAPLQRQGRAARSLAHFIADARAARVPVRRFDRPAVRPAVPRRLCAAMPLRGQCGSTGPEQRRGVVLRQSVRRHRGCLSRGGAHRGAHRSARAAAAARGEVPRRSAAVPAERRGPTGRRARAPRRAIGHRERAARGESTARDRGTGARVRRRTRVGRPVRPPGRGSAGGRGGHRPRRRRGDRRSATARRARHAGGAADREP